MLSKVVLKDPEALAALDLQEVSTADKTDIMGQVRLMHTCSNPLFHVPALRMLSCHTKPCGVEADSVIRLLYASTQQGLETVCTRIVLGRPVRGASKLNSTDLVSPAFWSWTQRRSGRGCSVLVCMPTGLFVIIASWHRRCFGV